MADEKKIEVFAADLREKIVRGDFGTKGRLPSVTQLAKDGKMARATVYQSLLLLRSQGLLYTKKNSYFVQFPKMRLPVGSPLFDKFLIDQGLTPKTINIEKPGIVPAPAVVAAALGLQEGDNVYRRVRLQGTEEVPYRIHENWYPLAVAEPFLAEMEEKPDFNVLGAYRKLTGNGVIEYLDRVITRLPTADEIEILRTVRTTPMFEVSKQSFSENEVPLMYVHSVLIGAFFELTYRYAHVRS